MWTKCVNTILKYLILKDLFPICEGNDDIIMDILYKHELIQTDRDSLIYAIVCFFTNIKITKCVVFEHINFIPVASPSSFDHSLTHSGGF